MYEAGEFELIFTFRRSSRPKRIRTREINLRVSCKRQSDAGFWDAHYLKKGFEEIRG